MTPRERQNRNEELARQRMFGASIRQIAKRHNLSKSHVHRLVRDVAIVCGSRRRKPEKPIARCTIVPCADGLGYRIVTL
jgi:hypothetical protein